MMVESMPLVVLEAMASGLSVIVTSNGQGETSCAMASMVSWFRSVMWCDRRGVRLLRANPDERMRMENNTRQCAMGGSWGKYQERGWNVLIDMERSEDVPGG
jgi:hypothetical protein